MCQLEFMLGQGGANHNNQVVLLWCQGFHVIALSGHTRLQTYILLHVAIYIVTNLNCVPLFSSDHDHTLSRHRFSSSMLLLYHIIRIKDLR